MSKSHKDKTVTEDKLIGMKVISAEGKLIGTVNDVGFTIGKTGISLSIETEEGQLEEISWDNIQGAIDFVVLKSTQSAPQYSSIPQTTQSSQPLNTSQPIQSAQPIHSGPQTIHNAQPVTAAQPIQQNQALCPKCKGALTFIPQYQRWYCYKCQKYA